MRKLKRGGPKVLPVLISFVLLFSLLWGMASKVAREANVLPSFEAVGISLLAPIASGAGAAWKWVSRYLWALTHLRTLLRENEELKRRLKEAEARNARLEECFRENRRLLALLDMRPGLKWSTIAARVVGRSLSNWSKIIILNCGSDEGVKAGETVVSQGALVGRVTEVGRRLSRVLLITDRQSGVGAIVQRSRELGIVKGTGGSLCSMQYLRKEADVRRGDRVVTSGVGSIFPTGIPIGRVLSIGYDPERGTLTAVVEPLGDLTKIEEVFILKISERW